MSNCKIDLQLDDYATFCRDCHPIARKVHTCGECMDKIQPGDKYEYVVMLYEGDFTTHKTCSACQEIRDRFFDQYYMEMIWETLKDEFDERFPHIGWICRIEGLSEQAIEKLSVKLSGWLEDKAEWWD